MLDAPPVGPASEGIGLIVQCIISRRFKPLEAGCDYAALSGGVPAARAMHDGDRTRSNRPFHRTPGTAPAQARQPPHDLASCAPLSVPAACRGVRARRDRKSVV